MDFVRRWTERTELPVATLASWLGIAESKFYGWQERYGKINEHNGWVPRDHWLEDAEKQAIIAFHTAYPLEGYRRLSFMMLDREVVSVSPSSVYRVLVEAGLMRKWERKSSSKGLGFQQPLRPHEHWHMDVSYLNISGTFYYLCSVLDGFSRFIVHWEIRETMTEADVETILQRAREKFPGEGPRIISDNGPQFIAKEFKAFIRMAGMTHVRTSPYYPQSNGKKERWYGTLKRECIRPRTPISLEDARRTVTEFVAHYNEVRLHSSVGYITPKDMLEGRAAQIHAARDRKLERARLERKARREHLRQQQANRSGSPHNDSSPKPALGN